MCLKLQKPLLTPPKEAELKITENLLSLGKRARSGFKFKKPPEKIIIHWIGPYIQRITTPRDWWESGSDGKGVEASAHFIVKDGEVLQALPLDEVGWHSGDLRNWESIGIEVCPANIAGEFSAATIGTLKELIRHIRAKYPGAKTIERHFDGVQGKDCPRYYTPVTNLAGADGRVGNPAGGEGRWERLKEILNGGG